jgi:hypothetical protein
MNHAEQGPEQETTGLSLAFSEGKRSNQADGDALCRTRTSDPNFTKIKPFFTCFRLCPQAILSATKVAS